MFAAVCKAKSASAAEIEETHLDLALDAIGELAANSFEVMGDLAFGLCLARRPHRVEQPLPQAAARRGNPGLREFAGSRYRRDVSHTLSFLSHPTFQGISPPFLVLLQRNIDRFV